MVLGKAYGQDEAIPLVLVEGLVEVESHALVGVGAILQIFQVVPVLIENQVAISCLACIEEAEVIEYRPLILRFHRLVVFLRSDFDTKSDSTAFFGHLYQHTVEVFVAAVEFLGSIVHILLFDMKRFLFLCRHVISLSQNGGMHRLGVCSVVSFHQAGIELCLSGSGESLALDNVCTAMSHSDILVDGASEILGISTIVFAAMTLVVLAFCERGSIVAIRESVVFYSSVFEMIGIFLVYLAVAESCFFVVFNERFVIMLQA